MDTSITENDILTLMVMARGGGRMLLEFDADQHLIDARVTILNIFL